MKNVMKLVGLFVLIGFSFFYTDRVIEVIKEEDEIMVELTSVMDVYGVLPVNATVLGNTIVPGISGRSINIDKSYKKMKSSGLFNKNLIVYDVVTPVVSINNNKDKFIVRGNSSKNFVSILFVLNDSKYFDKINSIFNGKGVNVNYFVSYSYLINNSTMIKEVINNEFYSYGDNGLYTPDNLLFSNNLISRIRGLEAKYCLTSTMDKDVLNLCSKNNLYTVVPTIVCDNNSYNMVKDNLSSGSIILLDMNQETVNQLATIIDYIRGKGFKIVGLSKLLNEELIIS